MVCEKLSHTDPNTCNFVESRVDDEIHAGTIYWPGRAIYLVTLRRRDADNYNEQPEDDIIDSF